MSLKGLLIAIAMTGTLNAPLYAGTASAFFAKALEHLQNNQKQEAVAFLQKAFLDSADPDERMDIAMLFLEASSHDERQRENFLHYVVKNGGDRVQSKWLRELGDRAFHQGDLVQAEKWYLRALNLDDTDPSLVEYKLAWVNWNQKRRAEALCRFLDLYPRAEHGFQRQIQRDVARLWWEKGRISEINLGKILLWPEDAKDLFFTTLFEIAPTKDLPTQAISDVLVQINETPRIRKYLAMAVNGGLFFRKSPCLLFEKVISPEMNFHTDHLLSCLKSPNKPRRDILLSFLERVKPATENSDWARAEVLESMGRGYEAAVFLLRTEFETRSPEYLSYLEWVVIRLRETDFKNLDTPDMRERFETLLKTRPERSLLARLQRSSPGRWIPFEEKLFADVKSTKDFLYRKGLWLLRQNPIDEAQLRSVYNEIIRFPLNDQERRVHQNLLRLEKQSNIRLPKTFSLKFKNQFDQWIREVDRALAFKGHAELQAISRGILHDYARKNILAILEQTSHISLDPDLHQLATSFEKRREELVSQIKTKYEEILGDL